MKHISERIHQIFGDHVTKRQYFLYFLVLAMIPLSLLILFVNVTCINQMEDNYRNILSQYAENLRADLDYTFQEMQSATNTIMTDREIVFLYQPDKPVDVWKLMTKMSENINRNKLIYDIYYCTNRGSDYIFSSTSSYTLESFVRRQRPQGLVSIEDLRHFLDNAQNWDILQTTFAAEQHTLFCCLHDDPSQCKRFLFFDVKNSTLDRLLTDALEHNAGYVSLSGKNGETVFSCGTLGKGGLSVNVSCQLAPYTIRMVVYSGSIISGLHTLRIIWISVLLLCVVFCFLAAFFMTRLSFMPLKLIRKSHSLEEVIAVNDYEALNKSIEILQSDVHKLESHSAAIRSLFIDKLISRESDAEIILGTLQNNYHFGMMTSIWQVAVGEIGSKSDSAALQLLLSEVLPAGVKGLIREPLPSGLRIVLLSYSSARTLDDAVLAQLLKNVGFRRIGIGTGCESLDQLPVEFLRAQDAYESTNDYKAFVPHGYSQEISEMSDIIMNESPAQIDRSRQAYLSRCESGEIQPSEYRINTLYLLSVARSRLAQEGLRSELLQIDRLPERIADSVSEWTIAFDETMSYFVRLLAANLNKAQNGHDYSVDEIVEYIDRHYMNADFSTAALADNFGMSINALNASFKAQKGCTVTQYLSDMKLAVAKQYLENSELSVYEIGLKLGYYGQNSFIRRFKQLTDMTPGEYRDKFRVKV